MIFNYEEQAEIKRLIVMEIRAILMDVHEDITEKEDDQKIKDLSYEIIYGRLLPKISARLYSIK